MKRVLFFILLFALIIGVAVFFVVERGKRSSAQKIITYKAEESALPHQIPEDTAPKRPVYLFFPDTGSNYLHPESRMISDTSDSIALIREIVQAVIDGPADTSLAPVMPRGTQLIEAYLHGREIVLDFSKELSQNHPGGSNGEIMTVYSIVNSLLYNLKFADAVQILIEGEIRPVLKGHIDISRPIYYNSEFVLNTAADTVTASDSKYLLQGE